MITMKNLFYLTSYH